MKKYDSADICSINTGEVLHTFNAYETNMNDRCWMMSVVKAEYTIVKIEESKWYNSLTIWVDA